MLSIDLFNRSIEEHSNTVEIVLLREVSSSTHTLSAYAISSNLVALDQSVLYALSTSLRESLILLSITLGRSITLNQNLSVLVVTHVLSNHLDACILSSVDSALALTEDYDRLELCVLLNNNLSCRSGLVLASGQLSLKVRDGAVSSSNLTILRVALGTELVDLSIQLINLALVAELSLSKVVSTVAISELVVQTDIQLEQTVTAIILHISTNIAQSIAHTITIVLQTEDDSRLNIELKSLGSTQIESKIQSSLRGQTISLTQSTESVLPTEAIKGNQLKSTGLTFISTKQVAQVKSTQQANICSINDGLVTHHRLRIALRHQISICVNSQTEYGGQILTQTDTGIGSEALSKAIVTPLLHRSSSTTLNAEVPVVTELV